MSNGVTMSDGGKGSAPRKKRDDEAYSKGWDAIFGKKTEHEKADTRHRDELKSVKDLDDGNEGH